LPLTGLRAVAAWWVVAFHFARGLVPSPLARLIGSGHVAVDLFFVLSGFVLAHRCNLSELSTPAGRRAFYWRRFARLYPVYLVSLATGFYAECPRAWDDLATSGGRVRIVAQLALLNAVSHKWMFRHNWAAWSLSVEAFMYLLFPWTVAWLSRRSRRFLLGLLVGCALAAVLAPLIYTAVDPDHLGRPLAQGDEILWSWYLKFFPLQRLPIFIAGVAAGRLAREVAVPGLLAVLAAVVVFAVAMTGMVPYAFLQGGALTLVFVGMVSALSGPGGGGVMGRWLASAPCVLLGRASYATYILHVPLFLLFARFEPAMWESGWLVAGYALLLLVLSLVAHRATAELAYPTARHSKSGSSIRPSSFVPGS